MKDVAIQFFNGIDEKVIPEIRLTKSKDGQAGQAFFRFNSPDALLSDNFKEIQGMYLICLLYTSPSPRDGLLSRMPSSA